MAREISVSDAAKLIENGEVQIVDIRDPQSFAQGHIAGAVRLDNNNVAQYLQQADKQKPVIVCCYHGNASQAAADFFTGQGFSEAYSLKGGMSEWVLTHPVESE